MSLRWTEEQTRIYRILAQYDFKEKGNKLAQADGYSRSLVAKVLVAVKEGDKPEGVKSLAPEAGEKSILNVSFLSSKAILNPEIVLIFDAAREQLDYDNDLANFIYDCVDFSRRYFKLAPPGWALIEREKFDLPKEWDSVSDRLIQQVFGGKNGDRETSEPASSASS